jgi:CBS domain-containing membrane protein
MPERTSMITATEIMIKDMIGLMPGSSMQHAFGLMQLKEIRHLPVFDADKKLVGILSERDVIKAMTLERSELDENVVLKSNEKVFQYMTSPVRTVDLNSPLTEVLALMIEHKISAVMVMKKNDYVEILTTEDLMKCFVSFLTDKEELGQMPVSNVLSYAL